ncbi:GDSL lipase/esterase protein [Dioscorea alata]|uniref:GDSL lipase/esterase protein n=1 Tax=Dioscorea alata TaxID=55571 RepID=A0ACB7VPJ8_DIOAL|nr:GDSL lipase/esterase protein [Dioscorea alata]
MDRVAALKHGKAHHMEMKNMHALHLFLRLHTFAQVLLLFFSFTAAESRCILFNFGDSNSDTGGFSAGLGFYLGPPSGRLFFHRTTGRFSDGRLYIDFLCEGLKINYMSPYLESSAPNFTHGVNFAVTGGATDPTVTFPLSTQVLQFLHFKNRTRELWPQGSGSLIDENGFKEAVYSFDIGQNDISKAFTANLSYTQVIERIPSILSRIKDALKTIYENGGTKLWVYNTGPLGCLPQTLALRKQNDSKIDENGCLADYNDAAKVFNAGLLSLCDELNSEFKNATIVYTDMFAIKFDLIANHSQYGFERPLMACCGRGGPPYNYVNRMTCGQPTASPCPLGSRYVSWDGVHHTEAANQLIAEKILSSKYSRPKIMLTSLCKDSN